jgi:hypothetical protein
MAPTEMVHCSPPLSQPVSNTPPDSPRPLPVVALSDGQATEMANAVAAMQMAPSAPSSHHSSCQPPPGSPPPSLATETAPAAPGSPTPCNTCSAKSSSQVAVEFAQQFMDALKSINSKQGAPPPPAKPPGESGQPKARASRLEFKTVNEVYVFNAARIQAR